VKNELCERENACEKKAEYYGSRMRSLNSKNCLQKLKEFFLKSKPF
jgi:hypothetical protein